MDAEQIEQLRAQQRAGWECSAAFWESGNDAFYAAAAPVSDWLVDHLDPRPGQRLLELAAGRGDLSLRLAAAVAPGGTVVCSDGADAMVEVARRWAQASGAGDGIVEHRQLELEWIDAAAASFDAVACRFGYMLCVDPETALRETRRVLRPRGRVAFAVWGPAAENEWLAATARAAIDAGHMPRPEPGAPGPFVLGSEERLRELLAAAGFVSAEVEAIAIAVPSPSLDAAWERSLEASEILRGTVNALSPAEHYRLRDAVDERWSPFLAADGTLVVPGLALCVVAEA